MRTRMDEGRGSWADEPVSLHGVSHGFGKGDSRVNALDDVTCRFAAQTWTAVMGPSGSGKSTLLSCAAGLLRAEAGEIRLAGVDVRTADVTMLTRLRRDQVGFVFQAYNLVPSLTAAQNVELPHRLAGVRPEKSLALAALARVGLDGRANARPDQLSGGQQQRVAIARALATSPAVLFADEPTGALDTVAGETVLRAFHDAVAAGACVVMVTHDPMVAAQADRVLYLVDGRLVAEHTGQAPAEIATTLSEFETWTRPTRADALSSRGGAA